MSLSANYSKQAGFTHEQVEQLQRWIYEWWEGHDEYPMDAQTRLKSACSDKKEPSHFEVLELDDFILFSAITVKDVVDNEECNCKKAPNTAGVLQPSNCDTSCARTMNLVIKDNGCTGAGDGLQNLYIGTPFNTGDTSYARTMNLVIKDNGCTGAGGGLPFSIVEQVRSITGMIILLISRLTIVFLRTSVLSHFVSDAHVVHDERWLSKFEQEDSKVYPRTTM
ncbi:hypothetical protein F5878DRAFT_691973 [Lentinula raphanica]|uniref:Uncharacterized protein n=1 Tax=Lentinula raphanica TaxID=153919 RepID=A0AA38UAU9_9AGAR|nr:hypothetical protein F5878DRAFT_691973 [Lentinula raphanica]